MPEVAYVATFGGLCFGISALAFTLCVHKGSSSCLDVVVAVGTPLFFQGGGQRKSGKSEIGMDQEKQKDQEHLKPEELLKFKERLVLTFIRKIIQRKA